MFMLYSGQWISASTKRKTQNFVTNLHVQVAASLAAEGSLHRMTFDEHRYT